MILGTSNELPLRFLGQFFYSRESHFFRNLLVSDAGKRDGGRQGEFFLGVYVVSCVFVAVCGFLFRIIELVAMFGMVFDIPLGAFVLLSSLAICVSFVFDGVSLVL